jgi:hypothetical protein
MARIHFIGGEKGGVGKSLVARLLAQYLLDRQQAFIGFDSDRSHGALMRFYAGYASPVLIDRYESLDAVVEAAVENHERRVLVDLAAQTFEPLTKWLEESDVPALQNEVGLSIRYWHVMDNGRDSVDLLKRLLEQFGRRLQYTLVLNQLRGDDFALFEQSGLKHLALELGAQMVVLPRLQEAAMTKIDVNSCSFWAATNSADKSVSGLGLLERQRVKTWLKKVYEGFDLLDI